MVDGKFLVQIKSVELSSNILKRLYEHWIAEKVHEIFEDKIEDYLKKLDVKIRRIDV